VVHIWATYRALQRPSTHAGPKRLTAIEQKMPPTAKTPKLKVEWNRLNFGFVGVNRPQKHELSED